MTDPVPLDRRDMLLTLAAVGGAAMGSGAVEAAGAAPPAAPSSPSAPAPRLPQVAPEELGLDPRRLQVAYDVLDEWTKGPDAPVPGGAILVGRHGKTVAPRFFGRQGPEPGAEPIRRDAMFYMASVTKPVIYLAAMQFVERGRLNLSDRVTRYLPEFVGEGKDETRVLHLFTHTSGLPDEPPNNPALRARLAPFADFVKDALSAPLAFPSGTDQSYSSSATLLTAEIVQRLSGLSIREYVKREILDPLGLKSTGLGAQGFAPERLVRTTIPDYQKGKPGDWNSTYWREFGSPAGGLFASPEDYAALCAAMLDGGKLGEARILSPAGTRMMTTNRLDDLPDLPEAIRRTRPWGLGWRLNHLGTSDSWGDLLDRNVFGHTGSAGNVVWMDPRTGGFCLILTNYLRARAPWRLVHLANAVAAAFG